MQPEFEDETPINPFDFWQGANFKLKLKKVTGYWNYDSSEFDRVSPLLDDDEAMELNLGSCFRCIHSSVFIGTRSVQIL